MLLILKHGFNIYSTFIPDIVFILPPDFMDPAPKCRFNHRFYKNTDSYQKGIYTNFVDFHMVDGLIYGAGH